MTTRTVVIHQPDFMPYAGFFQRFLNADLYIALDHVQFVKGTSKAWTHRDKIKTRKGEEWLSLSVNKCGIDTPINQVVLADGSDWKQRNLNLIRENYRDCPFFNDVFPLLEKLYELDVDKMMDFNLASITMLMDLLDTEIPITLSSELSPSGSKNEMLIGLLQQTNATHYLSGTGARSYMDEKLFNDAGIEVIWQDFSHPVYKQAFGEFIPALSSIDMLFNCGIDSSRKLLRSTL